MEMVLNNGFCEMSQDEVVCVDGGIGLLGAVLICGGCFLLGAAITVGVCYLISK